MVWDTWSFEDLEEKDQLLDQLITKVFVEQPRLLGSVNYKGKAKFECKKPGVFK